MAMVRSFAVGSGDMFYVRHNSDNFTIIDCQLFGDHKEWLVAELKAQSADKGLSRFISTHPDEDHLQGIEYLDKELPIYNFYVVKNNATKKDESPSFKHYCSLRDGNRAYYVEKGCTRRWMNQSNEERATAGINILWPDTSNDHFRAALASAAIGEKFNNISLVARYSVQDSASFMWIGDLETQFMEDIYDDISLPRTNVVFAPHHGRRSGKLPNKWLDKLQPDIVVLGEAKSRHLDYYTGYNTITQTSAGDITFKPSSNRVYCYASRQDYGKRPWLTDEGRSNQIIGNRQMDYYIGTLVF